MPPARRRRVCLVAVAALAAALAGPLPAAGAQAPGAVTCAAPEVLGFFDVPPPKDGFSADVTDLPVQFRIGRPVAIRVSVRDATQVEFDWGDGGRSSAPVDAEGTAPVRHVFARPRRAVLTAVAVAACGARSAPARLTRPVFPDCRTTLGADRFEWPCETHRSRLGLSAAGLSSRPTWLNQPCRDSGGTFGGLTPPERRARARAASCVPPPDPVPVKGHLPLRPGGRLLISLGARATRVTAELAGRSHRARRLSASGRRWRLRVPRALPPGAARMTIRAQRGRSGADAWVAGIRSRER